MNAAHLGLLTIDQCAELLQCSVSQVERFIRAGELKRVPLSIREVGKGPQGPRCWRVKPSALEDFIASRESFEPQPNAPAATAVPSPAPPRSALNQVTGNDGKKRLNVRR